MFKKLFTVNAVVSKDTFALWADKFSSIYGAKIIFDDPTMAAEFAQIVNATVTPFDLLVKDDSDGTEDDHLRAAGDGEDDDAAEDTGEGAETEQESA